MKKIYLLLVLTLFSIGCLHAQTPEFWGMTEQGGEFNSGVIFKTDTNGNNYSVQESFIRYKGKFPVYTKLLEATNGKLYGMVAGSEGTPNDQGMLFEYDPGTGLFTIKITFENLDGRIPTGSLMQASNGNLYGMTSGGGVSNRGVIFEYNIDEDIYTKKFDFDGSVANGGVPFGSLVQADNGKLYGMASEGGDSNLGILFEYDPGGESFSKKLDFDGADKGSSPFGSLILADNSKLYGMTRDGGTTDLGVLFEFDPGNNSYTKIIDFDGATSGSKPYGDLMQANNGRLYGMTSKGGSMDSGVLFEFDPGNTAYTKKLDFDVANTGTEPRGSLMQADDGKLFGMTLLGGTMGRGVIFEYDVDTDVYITKIDFDIELKGEVPNGSLMQASDGKLYGMAKKGGILGNGVFFDYDPDNEVFNKIIDFGASYEGSFPRGSLMQANNGKLYGMTSDGGEVINSLGVLFEYDPVTNTFVHKFDFDGFNGRAPQGTLIQASNNKLYGMTSEGGSSNNGVLFEYNIQNDVFTKKINFDGPEKGRNPFGALFQASNGKLYGMTRLGGSMGVGVFFEFDPDTDSFIKLLDLDGPNFGSFPTGSLTEAENGKLFGMTPWGGTSDSGVLFEYDLGSNTYTKLLDFDGQNTGKKPQGSLIPGADGKLYGMTSEGGVWDNGVLFEYDLINDTYTKKIDFDGPEKGSKPFGTLLRGNNGKLYGTTKEGGEYDLGVLFEYDPVGESFARKLDFDGSNGQMPVYGNLIEVIDIPVGINKNVFDRIAVFPNPANENLYIKFPVAMENIQITIIDMLGKKYYSMESINAGLISINTADFSKGVYILNITADGENFSKKLIVE